MSELERKNLIINNRCQHLLNTYSVPGLFPGITSLTLPNNSRRQKPSSPLFCREGNKRFSGDYRAFPKLCCVVHSGKKKKKIIQVFPQDGMEKSKWTIWPTNISCWWGKKHPTVTQHNLYHPGKVTIHISILKALRSPVVKKPVGVSVTSVGTSLGLLIRRHSLGNADLTLAFHLTNGVRKA